jgi:hypothetical protein
MQLSRPYFALFLVLLSMPSLAFIPAVLHEVAAITILQFDVINFCGATISTTYICLCHAAHYYNIGHPIDDSSLPHASQEDISTAPLLHSETESKHLSTADCGLLHKYESCGWLLFSLL